MIINKSLFPVSRGYVAIADMQRQIQTLQLQLATGERASSLSELGHERLYDLTIRARQGKIEAYKSNIDTVNLRIDFLNNVVSRLDEIESDSRSAAASGGGENEGTGIVTAQTLASARLDEVLTVLRTQINGRYMFGGNVTDAPPVETSQSVLNGSNGRDGFRTIVSERKLADVGANGHGRLVSDSAQLTSGSPAADTVSLTEDDAGLHPHRPQITGIATSNPGQITLTGPAGAPVSVDVQFGVGVAASDTVTIDVTLPDGTVEPRVFTAVAGPPVNPGEFEIGATPTDTANNFRVALDAVMIPDTVTLTEDGAHIFGMKLSTVTTDSAAVSSTIISTPAAAGVNTFAYAADATAYGAGDTTTFEVSVDGGPATLVTIDQATVLGVGNNDNVIDDIAELEAVLTAALTSAGVTGVTVSNDGSNILLTSNTPGAASNVTISNFIGDADGGGAVNTGHGIADGAGTTGTAAGSPRLLSVRFTGNPAAGEYVSVNVTMPDGTAHAINFNAVTSATPAARQFQIGATPDATAANFHAALNAELTRLGKAELAAASAFAASDNFFAGRGETVMRVDGPPFESATGLVAATPADTVIWYTGQDSPGRARETVQAQVDDGTVVNYGVQANESGIATLIRSLAAMAVENFSQSDPNRVERYQAITQKQTTRLSESNDSDTGSIEVISLELGIAFATNGQAENRHTMYAGQLDSLLADIETVPIEEVAVNLLSLQTRLEASYQTTAAVSRLTLVNYIS